MTGQVPPVTSALLDTEAAAAMLGVSARTLETDRVRGGLGVPFVKLSNRAVRYRQADLLAWIDARVKRPLADL